MAPEEPTTEELRLAQVERERGERDRAAEAGDESEAHAHARRADRAAYLAEKLDEQAASERDA